MPIICRTSSTPFIFAALLHASLLAGCATPERPKENAVQKVEREAGLGRELSEKLNPRFDFLRDEAVEDFLRKTLEKILLPHKTDEEIQPGAYVFVVRDKQKQKQKTKTEINTTLLSRVWRNFGLPGNRVYISEGVLKHCQAESEVAAALALEIAHVQNEDLIHNLRSQVLSREEGAALPTESSPKTELDPEGRLVVNSEGKAEAGEGVGLLGEMDVPKEVDFFGPGGLFFFPLGVQAKAIGKAAELLYQAGYDLRALNRLWEIYLKNLEHSPFTQDELERLYGFSKNTIREYPPLRNPIVNGPKFEEIKKRLQKI